MAIQVLIACDQPILRKGLSALLESARVHVIGTVAHGSDAVHLVQTRHPDVVVLDQCGPSFSDLSVMQRILQASATTKIVLLTVRGEERDVLPALQVGISGYVLKTDAADLAQAIQEVSRGMIYLSRSVSSVAVKAYLASTEPAAEHPHAPCRSDHPPHVEEQPPAATTQAPRMVLEQRRLAAIMFTDMVGYSALTHENEPLALELVERHNGLMRQRFVEHGGREIKSMGDGFLVVFASALDAARCAVAIQSAVHERNAVEPRERVFQVRIGIHVGDVVHREDDVFGQGVNIASRLERLARPGGICLSEQAANLIRNTIDRPMIKLGKVALKNIQTPVGVYHIHLPWEERRAPLFDRVLFSIFQRKTPSFADLTSAAFIATVASLAIWQSATHKAIHAMVWFGEGIPLAVGSPDRPELASLALVGSDSSRSGGSIAGKRTTEEPVTLRSSAQVDASMPLPAAPQPRHTSDLLTLMVRQDSGRTFHFARYYDHVTKQLRKKPGSASPAFLGPMRDRQAFIQQAMSEGVPIRVTKPSGTGPLISP